MRSRPPIRGRSPNIETCEPVPIAGVDSMQESTSISLLLRPAETVALASFAAESCLNSHISAAPKLVRCQLLRRGFNSGVIDSNSRIVFPNRTV
jgi:hypothetical protein